MIFLDWLLRFLNLFKGRTTAQIPVPADIVDQHGITYYEVENKIVIDLGYLNIPFSRKPKIRITTVQDTNSMLPVFDALHTCILVSGADVFNQKIMLDWLANQDLAHSGNILIYRVGDSQIIHRVVGMNEDSEGRYWTFKGDHTFRNDPYKVRDEQIESLVFNITY